MFLGDEELLKALNRRGYLKRFLEDGKTQGRENRQEAITVIQRR